MLGSRESRQGRMGIGEDILGAKEVVEDESGGKGDRKVFYCPRIDGGLIDAF